MPADWVRISKPSGVTSTVCSHCAESEWSAVTIVQPSAIPGQANVGQGGLVEPETDPEPSNQIQINTRRDGSVVVVPPLGSRAPKKVFPAGMPVDATYIQKIDNPDSE